LENLFEKCHIHFIKYLEDDNNYESTDLFRREPFSP